MKILHSGTLLGHAPLNLLGIIFNEPPIRGVEGTKATILVQNYSSVILHSGTLLGHAPLNLLGTIFNEPPIRGVEGTKATILVQNYSSVS